MLKMLPNFDSGSLKFWK